MKWKALLVSAAVLCIGLSGLADVVPASPFTNHMMIQRDLAAPVWGTAAPDEKITVRFAGQEKTAAADKNGNWRVKLDPVKANAKGQPLEIAGKNAVKLQDVLVGDIWICSGQSNMEMATGSSLNGKAEVAAAKFPAIRLFNVQGHVTSPTPLSRLNGQWQICSPQSVGGFSAVGYFFARRLHKETGVPIGLIGTNWGGTRIEPWTPPVGFRSVP
ncbi:9-O-acetylesterase, partial [bacterium]|nr:9-O-acetylesterase [bacterium]